MVAEMTLTKRRLKLGGLALLAFFGDLDLCRPGRISGPRLSLAVDQIAEINNAGMDEVNPGQTFYYLIAVTNK